MAVVKIFSFQSITQNKTSIIESRHLNQIVFVFITIVMDLISI